MPSFLDIKVGWFLALRQVRRANPWTNGLIIFVMVLTFLDLVVVTGLLVGLVAGIMDLYKAQETGDVYISTLDTKNYIDHSEEIVTFLRTLPQIANVSARYTAGAEIEANYKTAVDPNVKPNETSAELLGVDPVAENALSNVSSYVGEGSYLAPNDLDGILLGSNLIDRYSFGGDILPGISALHNIYPGSKVLVTVNGASREMTVRGIIVTTANSPLASRAIIPAEEMRQILGRDGYQVNEIAIKLKSGADAAQLVQLLDRSGVSKYAKVRTADNALPSGVSEVTATFAEIGNAISSLGLVVASITVFIVIFINAVTRRKFIGILKGIGISAEAIECSYVFQSLFYALIGSAIGLVIVYGVIVPYFTAHPIVLPISRAIIVAPLSGTLLRVLLLVSSTVVAGYIPARMIVQKNTLDSILGRD